MISNKYTIELDRQFISVDEQKAISSYGEVFSVNQIVSHQDTTVGVATILSFYNSITRGELMAKTDKGFAGVDFLVAE